MKKKLLWTMGLAAAMTAGMAGTAMADWYQQGGDWYFTDSRNDLVRNEWVLSGDEYYYLGNNGKMVTNSLIDDTYYVDGNGVRVKNAWQWVQGDWYDDDTGWKYFGANGKAYENGVKEIGDQWYYFDDTVMQTGWHEINGSTYYFRDSGERVSGWRWMADQDEDDWNEYWFYFSNAGKLYKNQQKTIDGVDYIFDDAGRMLTGWVNTEDFTSTGRDDLSDGDYHNRMFFKDSGAAADGWLYLNSTDESGEYWYYFREGKPYSTSYKTTRVGEYGMAKIGSDYYCFDYAGRMYTGLLEIDEHTRYYFDEDNGAMHTGRVEVNNDDYYRQEFYFATSGSAGERGLGVTGVKDGRLYEYGFLVAADEGMKYQRVVVAGKTYLVNEDGKIKTSGTVRDADGVKYEVTKVDGNYRVEIVDYD